MRFWQVVGCLTLAAQAQVQAQAPTTDVQLAPSPFVSCLTPAQPERGVPEYPFEPWKRQQGGHVLVELTFTGATRPPEVKVVANEGDEALVKAVKDHVAGFRVPCAQGSEAPVRLRQNYVFEPDRRHVVWTTPSDMADAGRQQQLKCMAAVDGSKKPDYPDWARREGVEGNMLVKLRFTARDQPPETTVHAATRELRILGRSVQSWAKNLRMPCLEGPPVEAIYTMLFRLEGTPAYGFRNIGFLEFLRKVKDLDKQDVRFDTQTMGCPFDVALTYRQPYYPNGVGQPDGVPPVRQPFLDWLSTLTLDLSSDQMASAVGDTARFTVPCIRLDLKPKG